MTIIINFYKFLFYSIVALKFCDLIKEMKIFKIYRNNIFLDIFVNITCPCLYSFQNLTFKLFNV